MIKDWLRMARLKRVTQLTFADATKTMRVQVETLAEHCGVPASNLEEFEPLFFTIWTYYFVVQNVGLRVPQAVRQIDVLSAVSGALLNDQLHAKVDAGRLSADEAKSIMTNSFGKMDQIFRHYDAAFNQGKVTLRVKGSERPDFALPLTRAFIERLCLRQIDRSLIARNELVLAQLLTERLLETEKLVKEGV